MPLSALQLTRDDGGPRHRVTYLYVISTPFTKKNTTCDIRRGCVNSIHMRKPQRGSTKRAVFHAERGAWGWECPICFSVLGEVDVICPYNLHTMTQTEQLFQFQSIVPALQKVAQVRIQTRAAFGQSDMSDQGRSDVWLVVTSTATHPKDACCLVAGKTLDQRRRCRLPPHTHSTPKNRPRARSGILRHQWVHHPNMQRLCIGCGPRVLSLGIPR